MRGMRGRTGVASRGGGGGLLPSPPGCDYRPPLQAHTVLSASTRAVGTRVSCKEPVGAVGRVRAPRAACARSVGPLGLFLDAPRASIPIQK